METDCLTSAGRGVSCTHEEAAENHEFQVRTSAFSNSLGRGDVRVPLATLHYDALCDIGHFEINSAESLYEQGS